MIYALIIYILTFQNQSPVDVWLFYYNPSGKITIESKYCRQDAPTISECLVPKGVTELELKITAPCHMATVPILVSEDWFGRRRQVYWISVPNSSSCAHKSFLPLIATDSDTKPYPPR